MLPEKEHFADYKMCNELKCNQKCFKLQKYAEGNFEELFHEHVPKHRISSENALAFMKTLAVQHSQLGDNQTLQTYLNNRGKNPNSIQLGQVFVEYPEPGVLRKYYSAGNITVWYDEVIASQNFRLDKEQG